MIRRAAAAAVFSPISFSLCALLVVAGLLLPACGGSSRSGGDDGRTERAQGTRDRADAAFAGAGMHDTRHHQDYDRRDAEGNVQPREANTLPAWAYNPPSAPGQYYYGVGMGYFQHAGAIGHGLSEAQDNARRELASTIRTEIQAASQRFSEQVLRPEGTVVEQGWSRQMSMAVTDQIVVGAAIIDIAQMPDPGSDLNMFYALARISFEDVAESMRLQAERDLERQTTMEEVADALLDRFGLDPDPTVGRNERPRDPEVDRDPGTTRPNGSGSVPTTRNGSGVPTTRPGDGGVPTTGGGHGRPGTEPGSGVEQVTDDRVRMWVEQRRDPEYSQSEYLIGVGTGTNTNDAIAAGRQEIVAYFSTEISGATRRVSESLHRLENESRYVRESMHSMAHSLQVIAGTLRGARVAGTGQYRGQHAALVVVNRRDFIQQTRSMIEQKEREIGDILSSARRLLDDGRAVAALRTLSPAFRLQSEVLTLIAQYNLVASETRQPTYTTAQIEELVLGLAGGLSMMIHIEVQVRDEAGNISERPAGEVIERIQSSLTAEGSGVEVLQTSRALSSRGVSGLEGASASEISAMADGAAFVVYGTVESGYNQLVRGRLYEYTATYDLTVLEVASGRTWRIAEQSGRQSRGTNQAERQAAGAALERAANRIGYDIVDRLVRGN